MIQTTQRLQPSITKRMDTTPTFTLTFSAVFFVTLISLIVLVTMAYFPPKGGEDADIEIFRSAFQMGFSVMVGLIAGKTL